MKKSEKADGDIWVRKMISLSPHTASVAQEMADKWYAGNLSAFLASRVEHSVECQNCAINNSFKISKFTGNIVNRTEKPKGASFGTLG